MDEWLTLWQEVRRICDAFMKRNRTYFRLRPHAEELGSADEFDELADILDNGTGAARQTVVYEANHDLHEVAREIIDASVPEGAETRGE